VRQWPPGLRAGTGVSLISLSGTQVIPPLRWLTHLLARVKFAQSDARIVGCRAPPPGFIFPC